MNGSFSYFSVMGMILAGYTAIVLCFCLAIGGIPGNLGVAVANYEISEIDRMAGFCPVVSQNCTYELLSCRYLSILSGKAKVVKFFIYIFFFSIILDCLSSSLDIRSG